MDLTQENKNHIDSLSYQELLQHRRSAPIGDKWFEGETGEYWLRRMKELRNKPEGEAEHVRASKEIGWR